MWFTPWPVTSAQGNNRTPHSNPNPRPRLANIKMIRQWGMHNMTPAVPFLNPDLITHLMGQSNKTPVIIDMQKVTVLIDSGVQGSCVS